MKTLVQLAFALALQVVVFCGLAYVVHLLSCEWLEWSSCKGGTTCLLITAIWLTITRPSFSSLGLLVLSTLGYFGII